LLAGPTKKNKKQEKLITALKTKAQKAVTKAEDKEEI
jgi:hypothetical protein